MIQVNNSVRRPAPALPAAETNGPEVWGQWCGRKHYSLEVTQHPIRARMCGFGDKDRRPLAPAAVAKMIVRRDDNSLVDVDDIDCSFFLVTVDLWSADGKSEMNLVLHPSSADRYVPPHITKPRRRGASITAPQQRSGYQTPASRSTPTPSHYRSADNPNNITTPMLPPQPPGFSSNQGYFAPQSASSDTLSYGPSTPFSATPSDTGHPTWGYPPQSTDRNSQFSPPALPSIHSFGRNTAPSGMNQSTVDSWHPNSQGDLSYRAWNTTDPSYPGLDFGNSQSQPSSEVSIGWIQPDSFARGPRSLDNFSSPQVPSQYDSSVYNTSSQSFNATSQSSYYPSANNQSQTHNQLAAPAGGVPIHLPRHTYTRTLVGPLSANATRLLDEHRKPGIFFLFQDLSVRTEGTFRLRMRLMNVGAPPAPEAGALSIHTEVSPVLAQTFTEPFTVFSAKRFPGVPDTTALSIAFGNQGQKLPLRNRNGSSSSKRRRRGESDEDESEED
ncbi:hypothetical protein K435DRAFT_958870 [Dendrothele bispora CBS 962.96]|uniref:Velvet domain-containing protein n=1 Tax=Dendrothele bispora (strain CBS 962.96) TaxID=1314807 RepID=A0A4S8N097_DENBC|nr:hypothetical protein K435DRAFT_958870 [Dendrothele bispora CBS 962.96]